MSRSARKNNRRTRSPGRRSEVGDFWYSPRPIPETAPIDAPAEAGALLRSLGDPPINGGTPAGHYFNAVIERASAVAVALALSADVLAAETGDDDS